VVELNEYECLVDSLEILRIIAKHSKFFEVHYNPSVVIHGDQLSKALALEARSFALALQVLALTTSLDG